MKKIVISALLFFCPVSQANPMQGFGAHYYDVETDASPPLLSPFPRGGITPDIIVGEHIFTMEFSPLKDIARSVNTVVNHSEGTSWVCLTAKDINYWFISDNAMGNGGLTAIAMAKDGQQKGCRPYDGEVRITLKSPLLLTESVPRLLSYAGKYRKDPSHEIVFCDDSKQYGNATQLNCVHYYFDNIKVNGIVITQVTTN